MLQMYRASEGNGEMRSNQCVCDRSDSHEVAVVFDNFSHFTHPQGYKSVLDAYHCMRRVNTVSSFDRDYEDIQGQGQSAGEEIND